MIGDTSPVRLSRRHFLLGATIGGVSLVLAGCAEEPSVQIPQPCGDCVTPTGTPAPRPTDVPQGVTPTVGAPVATGAGGGVASVVAATTYPVIVTVAPTTTRSASGVPPTVAATATPDPRVGVRGGDVVIVTPATAPVATATGVASAPSQPTATALPPRMVTPTVAATATGLTTWTDPRGLIQLRYPRDWRADTVAGRKNNILQLSKPQGNYFNTVLWLDLVDTQRGNLDDAVQRIRDGWVNQPYRLSDQTVDDIVVGGEAAKAFACTSTPTFNPTIHERNRSVVCYHGGREFLVESSRGYDSGLVVAGREFEEVVASIRFLT